MNNTISQDVAEIFKNKTPLQLKQLEQRIRYLLFIVLLESFINKYFLFRFQVENEIGVNISYWESILSQLQEMKQEQGLFHAPKSTTTNISISTRKRKYNETELLQDLGTKCLRVYKESRYSSTLINIGDLNLKMQKLCIDETDDYDKIK